MVLKHLGGVDEFIAGLIRVKVEDELVDNDRSHHVVSLLEVLILIKIFFLNQLSI